MIQDGKISGREHIYYRLWAHAKLQYALLHTDRFKIFYSFLFILCFAGIKMKEYKKRKQTTLLPYQSKSTTQSN